MSKEILKFGEHAQEDQTILSWINDPAFFIQSSLSIIDKDSHNVPFILNPLQKAYMAVRTNRDIILKSRKMGFSTLILALWIHACITKQNARAVIVSHEKDATGRLLERLKFMLEHSGYPINYEATKSGVKFIDTDSTIWIGTAGSRNFGRGDDITHAHLSEPAFYESLEIITSVSEAMVNDGVLVLESTAKGAGTPHHDLWLRSARAETNYKTHFFGWFQDPTLTVQDAKPIELDDYEIKAKESFGLTWGQIAWRRRKIREMQDPMLFFQEYPATAEEAFLASGRMVFDWDAIKIQEDGIESPKWRGILVDAGSSWRVDPKSDGPFQVWKSAQDGHDYLVTADASQGIKGLDYGVADVWDTRTWEQVAQWRGYAAPDKFKDILYGIGCMYSWAVVACENNFPGNAVIMGLQERKYPNLWIDPSGKAMDLKIRAPEPGFKTTERTKSLMISDLREALRDMDIRLNSQYTLAELKSYVVQDDGKMEAQSGCHDDTVITASAAAYILKRWTLEPEAKRGAQRDHFRVRLGMARRSQYHGQGAQII